MFDEHRLSSWVARLALCVLTAIIIAGTAYICAWLTYRGEFSRRYDLIYSRLMLKKLREAIEEHKEKTGSLPPILMNLDIVKDEAVFVDDTGFPIDMWCRPIHYEIKGDLYKLYSLGRDGKPGGVGLDADLYADNDNPEVDRENLKLESVSIWEFSRNQRAVGIRQVCLLAGLFAFPIWLLPMKKKTAKQLTLVETLMIHIPTLVFAVLAAVVISALHVSGH